jgi:serralysin
VNETLKGAKRNKIFYFVSKIDKIELLTIDANSAFTGNQAFRFSGITVKANSVWYQSGEVDNILATKDIIVYGDIDGKTGTDFEIWLVGGTSVVSGDFVL